MIKQCSCEHAGQDILHGKGNRVFNEVRKGSSKEVVDYRCTVCGTSTHTKTKRK